MGHLVSILAILHQGMQLCYDWCAGLLGLTPDQGQTIIECVLGQDT